MKMKKRHRKAPVAERCAARPSRSSRSAPSRPAALYPSPSDLQRQRQRLSLGNQSQTKKMQGRISPSLCFPCLYLTQSLREGLGPALELATQKTQKPQRLTRTPFQIPKLSLSAH